MRDAETRARRETDGGFLCVLAKRAQQFWDFVDRRQIDAYMVTLVILYGTVKITDWAMAFTDKHFDKSGVEIAAIIAAVMVPWSALQTAAVKFLFDARQRSFLPGDK